MLNSLDNPMIQTHRPDYLFLMAQAVGVFGLVIRLNMVNIALMVNYLEASVNWIALRAMTIASNLVKRQQPLDYEADS